MSGKTLGFDSIKLDNFTGLERENAAVKISTKDIAVIGISCLLSVADNPDEFWLNLQVGNDGVCDFPENRRQDIDHYLQHRGFPPEDLKYLKGAFLEEIDKFDCKFFRLTPQEASLMNPIQRIFSEQVWTAIEDAGYGGEKLIGTNTGVYLGMINDVEGYKYKEIIRENLPDSLASSLAGNLSSIISSRISYLLDLKGPSLLVDTACSSSLVAVHLACQAIRNGDCEMALAGGIKINLLPLDQSYLKIGTESSDAMTRTFDDAGDGSGTGEGVGVVVLKPLYRAKRDRDHIYAVIKGSAVNQDGFSMGITAPNAAAQASVLVKAWNDAGINPETLSYIEAHGTATTLGDPIEIDGIKTAFERFTTKKQFCAIGSCKSNLGHLYDSAGIIGLIKMILALKNKQLPPSLYFKKPNRKIDFSNSPVYVNTKLRDWETAGHPRRCAISAFGFSGTNCHLILEEAPAIEEPVERTEDPLSIFSLSAKNKDTLLKLVEKYLTKSFNDNWRDICYTVNTGRGDYQHRLAFVAASGAAGLEKLRGFYLNAELPAGVHYSEHRIVPDHSPKENGAISETELKELNRIANDKIAEFTANGKNSPVILEELARLYLQGAQIKWDDLYAGEPRRRVSLPAYSFERQRYWLELPKDSATALKGKDAASPTPIPLTKSHDETSAGIAVNGGVTGLKDGISRKDQIFAMIQSIIHNSTRMKIEKADIHLHLIEIGFDSIILNQVRRVIQTKFGLDIPLKMFFDTLTTIDALTNYITNQLPADFPLDSGTTPAIAPRPDQFREQTSPAMVPLGAIPEIPLHAATAAEVPGLAGTALEQILIRQLEMLNQQHQNVIQIILQQLEIIRGQSQAVGYGPARQFQPAPLLSQPAAPPTVPAVAVHDELHGGANQAQLITGAAMTVVENGRGSQPAQLPLTEAQRQIWFVAQFGDTQSSAYNESVILRIRGTLDLETIRRAVHRLVDRHEALRTVISPDGETQTVLPNPALDIPCIDFSGMDDGAQPKQLQEWFKADSLKAFDLAKGPLIRVNLLKLNVEIHLLVLSIHHLVADGWSFGVLVREMETLYTGMRRNETIDLPQPVQFREYINWQQQQNQSANRELAAAFWREKFENSFPVLELPATGLRQPLRNYSGARQTMDIDAALTKKLRILSMKQDCSLFMTLLTVYKLFLHRLTGRDRIMVGIPTAGQLHFGADVLVGNCASILPICSQVPQSNFIAYLTAVKQQLLEIERYQGHAPALLGSRLAGVQIPPITAMFNIDRPVTQLNFADLLVKVESYPVNSVKYDLFLNIIEIGGELHLEFDYHSELFTPATIQHWMEYFRNLLNLIIQKPETALADLSLLTADQKTRLRARAPETAAANAQFIPLLERMGLKKDAATGAFLLDSYLQPAPVGVTGELYFDGINSQSGSVAAITNPFSADPVVLKAVKTGMLGRYLPDGAIELLGSREQQVRIRGYLVNLKQVGEIIAQAPGVAEALVMADEDRSLPGRLAMCAYVTSNDNAYSGSQIAQYLKSRLPEYMIPNYMVKLAKWPRASSGEIDAGALPQPDTGTDWAADPVLPENETERKLLHLWQQVLGTGRIGLDDNFFAAGGHSLKATILLSKAQQEFNVKIPLQEIFKSSTIRNLAVFIKNAAREDSLLIEPTPEKHFYPLSSAQQRMYALYQFDNQSTAYNISQVMVIEGDLDVERFETIFKILINRHETLRTSFVVRDGEPVQQIHPEADFMIEYQEVNETEIQRVVNEFIQPFDLTRAPLLRISLVKTGAQKRLFLFDMHHIIGDGFSMDVLIREINQLYRNEELPPLRIQYKDYAVWHNRFSRSEAVIKQEEYWLARFAEEIPVLNLPLDYPRPALQCFEGSWYKFAAGGDVTAALRQLALKSGATLYMTLLAAYNTMLYQYTGQEDIVVGAPIAGRPLDDLSKIIGMFVNTLPVRSYPKGNLTFNGFLETIKENLLKVYENQDYQLEFLLEKIGTQRDVSRNPLFDTIFVFQNTDNLELQIDGVKITPYEFEHKTTVFDITLEGFEETDRIRFDIQYCNKLFSRETIARMASHFLNTLRQITANPGLSLSEIDMLSAAERKQLLEDFNYTRSEYPKDKTLPELFERQAQRVPGEIAAVCGEHTLTYQELNQRSNQLARMLRKKGVEAGAVAGIMVERSLEMLIGILSILKAGGAYLPIDPKYPEDRIRYLLEDSGAKILLTQAKFIVKPDPPVEQVNLEDPEAYKGSAANLKKTGQPDSLAYIMYTSGSTGKPKGVMVTHRNISRLVINTNYIEFHPDDHLLQTGAVVFDASTFEIWGALLNGLRLYLVDDDVILNPEQLEKALARNQITILWLTAPLFNQLAQQNPEMFRPLKNLLVGGDVLSPKHINLARRHNPGLNIINGYGPTENTTFSACFSIGKDYEDKIPIGTPVGNSTAYITGWNNQLKPIGATGELCVGGDGVALGYLNQPELTAAKFIPNPFVPGERMYRTGDLARRLPDGAIEFIGRMDRQVKIRGFRIELGEIETRLLRHEQIKEAVVLVKEDQHTGKYLCAYLVAVENLNIVALREYLTAELPDYMVPSHFIQLEAMPLNVNGKIDKKALPEPDPDSIFHGGEYAAPRNQAEEELVRIWQEVLGIGRIGINDNFFVLGGDSIKAIQVSARLQKLHLAVNLKDLFRHPTIGELSGLVRSMTHQFDQGPVMGETGLTPIQKWFFEQKSPEPHHYNQSVMLYRREGFDQAMLRETFTKLAEHHDALRMIFSSGGGSITQFNRGLDTELYHLTVVELRNDSGCRKQIAEMADQLQSSIDICRGPLIRIGLFQTGDGDHLLIAIHHLVVDGVSWRIILEDFATVYTRILRGEQITVPDKTTSFKDWSAGLSTYATSRELFKEAEYWKEIESAPIPPLPTDRVVAEDILSGLPNSHAHFIQGGDGKAVKASRPGL